MSPTSQWIFGPFRVDPANVCLWRGDQMISLRPKVFAVLAYLVAQAGRLVTKEALFEAVWPETAVTDAVLKACIREVRRALGDMAQSPRFIATVHRRGYRFIAPVAMESSAAVGQAPADSEQQWPRSRDQKLPTAHSHLVSPIVERESCVSSCIRRWRRPPKVGAR